MFYALVVLNAWAVVRDHPLTYIEGTKNIESRRAFEIRDSARPALAACNTARGSGTDENFGLPEARCVHRNSPAPDHQRERQGILFCERSPPLPLTRRSSWPSMATRSITPSTHHPGGLTKIGRYSAPGQPSGTVYVSDTPPAAGSSGAVIASRRISLCARHWLHYFAQPFDFSWLQQVVVFNGAITRLLAACLLGGLIGLERENKRRAAGVRTNLLICMGARSLPCSPLYWPATPTLTKAGSRRISCKASDFSARD